MAKIKLKKNVISNQKAQELYDGAFNEVIISAEKIDDEKLKKIYRDLFYQISKRGKLSHEKILIKSNDVINPEININYDSQIKELEGEILIKNEKLLKLQIPPDEHPLFSNNIFLQEGSISNNIIEGETVWFVQGGYKRQITATPKAFINNILRKANNDNLNNPQTGLHIPLSDSPLLQLASADEINQIKEAQDINNGESLSIDYEYGCTDPTKCLIAKEVQEYIYSQLKVEFECFGVEKFYKFDEEERQTYPNDEGYWYIDTNASCEVTYQTDVDPSTTFEPQTNTITFDRYKTKLISRDQSLYPIGNPLDSFLYTIPLNTINETRSPDVFSTYYPTVNIAREWGYGNKFPAVANIPAGHRVKAKIIAPTTSDGNPIYAREGSPGIPEWTLLNGVNTKQSGQEDTFKFFDSISINDTRMINNFCYGPSKCWGKLNQFYGLKISDNASDSQNYDFRINKRLLDLFKNKNGKYYIKDHKSKEYGTWVTGKWSVSGKVYGQPILLVKAPGDSVKKLAVFLGGHRHTFTDWNVFYNLEDGDTIKISNASLENKVEGYKRDSTRFFNWLRKDDNSRINNPKLYYPGLKGKPINYDYTDLDEDPSFTGLENLISIIPSLSIFFSGDQINDNPFNPKNGGSMYELTLGDKLDIFDPTSINDTYEDEINEEVNNYMGI